ncbi:MAG: VOC family protein [Dehalococcoidales bacterium]|nr:VOC family protein [Dehalococcoidales bacterium]
MVKNVAFPFSNLDHIGIVVRDIDKAAASLAVLGVGPFKTSGRAPITEKYVRGKPVPYKVETRFAKMGPIVIELTQHFGGECIQKEFLDTKGEGLHHIGFQVNDVWGEADKLAKQGIAIEQSGKRPTGGGFLFFKNDAGLYIEFFQPE